MRELLADVRRWLDKGRRVALARLVEVEGSAPRAAGAAMLVDESGEVAGSISGGCVEGAVVDAALDCLTTGARRLLTFGCSDDDLLAVGLTCGGTLRVFVEPIDEHSAEVLSRLAMAAAANRPAALASVVEGSGVGHHLLLVPPASPQGSLGDPGLDTAVVLDAAADLSLGTDRLHRYGPRGEDDETETAVFVETVTAPPAMILAGATDFAAALSRLGTLLGYRVTVCDARAAFATPARFPAADEVVVDWPHRYLAGRGPELGPRDVLCLLTHDEKFDVPAIQAALATRLGFVGLLGSRRTTARRLMALSQAGVDEAGLARLNAPVGLDLGARTPQETAVSICAEIIARREARTSVHPLRATSGPIHRA